MFTNVHIYVVRRIIFENFGKIPLNSQKFAPNSLRNAASNYLQTANFLFKKIVEGMRKGETTREKIGEN